MRNKLDPDRSLITDEELKIIVDADSRRKAVGDGVLTVRDRYIGEDRCRIDDTTLENIHFINCRFLEHVMFGVSMKNVEFTNCGFANVRWEGGKWSGLKFFDCGFIDNAIRIGTGSGIGTNTFEKCLFQGSDPPDKDSDTMRLYGTFVGPGASVYTNCRFSRFELGIDTSARFVDCRLSRVVFQLQHRSGVQGLHFDHCAATEDFEIVPGSITEVSFVNSTLPMVSARKLKASSLTIDGSRGCFDFYCSNIERFSAKGSTFNHPANAEDVETGLGLSLAWIVSQEVALEDCHFEGKYARLDTAGAKPDYDANGKKVVYIDKATGKPESQSSQIKRFRLAGTPLVHGNLAYCDIGEFTMSGSRLADTQLHHCQINTLTLTNVQLAGKLDFTGTQVKKVMATALTRADLTIVKDATTQLALPAA